MSSAFGALMVNSDLLVEKQEQSESNWFGFGLVNLNKLRLFGLREYLGSDPCIIVTN